MNLSCRSTEPSVGGPKPLSSEMFFAFPHHLSQIIEEEERQSSRNSEELKHKNYDPVCEGKGEDIALINSDGPTKETNIGEKEKEKDDGNDNKDSGEETIDIKEIEEEESEETIRNKRKISRM